MTRWFIGMAILLFTTTAGTAQLTSDTLFFPDVGGSPGQQVVLPIYIKNTVAYQGWQIPIRFGDGTSPVFCDSISELGSCMENWVWTAYFINNNEWDNVQTCGAAGVVDWTGGTLDPGYWLVTTLYITIDPSAPLQTITVDTTTASWYSGGPQNEYVVTVGGQSRKTSVKSGSITVMPVGVVEEDPDLIPTLQVYPSIIRPGQKVTIEYLGRSDRPVKISLIDASGRMINRIFEGRLGDQTLTIQYELDSHAQGIYFVVLETRDMVSTRKILIQ